MRFPKGFLGLLRWFGWGSLLAALAVAGLNGWMIWRARSRTVRTLAALPVREIGIVLGTSPRVGHWSNPFFENRMDAAAALYRAGKVRRLLVSGDNRRKEYDEPTAMREALIRRGVPSSAITLDYAGFRTLDTMARAKSVFGVKQATLITDDFHQPRSLFLADEFGLQAIGYPSESVPLKWSLKTRLREVASRAWAWGDVYILHTGPKFH